MKEAIVIGADHYNTLWLVRSLGMAGFCPIAIIVGENNNNCFVAKSKYCTRTIYVKNNKSIILTLESLVFKEKVVIIASGDSYAELIDMNYNALSKKYILHDSNGQEGQISYWMNKSRMLEKAYFSGLNVPMSKSVNTDKFKSFDDLIFPCLIKPEVSAKSSKESFRICNNNIELKQSLYEIKNNCKRALIQEYVKTDYEVLIYGVRTFDGQVIIPGALKKIHTCNSHYNMGMMSFGCITPSLEIHHINRNAVILFLESINYHGIFSIEFMISNRKAYFIEINMRNDGTIYCTTKAGVNIPAIWTITANGLPIDNIRKELIYKKTYCMNEVNYMKYTILHQSPIKTMKEIIKTRAFSLFEYSDIRPLITKIIR